MAKLFSKKNKGFLWLIIILAVGFGAVAYFSQQFIITSTSFIKPSWGRYECLPTGSLEGQKTVKLDTRLTGGFLKIKRGGSITCGVEEFTDRCEQITIDLSGVGNLSKVYVSGSVIEVYNCEVATDNCNKISIGGDWITKQSKLIGLPDLDKNRRYFVTIETSFTDPIGAKIIERYRPWKIYQFFDGGKHESVAENCCFTQGSSIFGFIPQQESVPQCLTMTGGIGSKWVNYINEWNFGPATNIFNYGGKQVYCGVDHVLYDIATVQLKDGSIKQVNPEYVEDRNTPTYFQTQGKAITTVQCCPSEPNCGNDFKFTPNPPTKECFTDAQCYNGGAPVPQSSTTYVEYFCNKENKCEKSQPISVQCTNTNACPNGQICDLTLTNYGKCIQQTVPQFCGDNKCDRDESKQECPSDCGSDGSKPINFLPFLIIGLAVLIAIVVILFSQRRK